MVKAAARYEPRVRALLLQMEDPVEIRLSLPVPGAAFAEGLTELRDCLRKLRNRRVWDPVLAEVGMIHAGRKRDGWWNLHLHLFLELSAPLDEQGVVRAWKAITAPKKRTTWWRKRDFQHEDVTWRAGVVKFLGPVRSAEKAAAYVTRASQFAPDPHEIETNDFAELRKALAGKQLMVERGFNGRGTARGAEQMNFGDRLLSIQLSRRAGRVLHAVLGEIRRDARSSDRGVQFEKMCFGAIFPFLDDRWAAVARLLEVVEAQLACELIAIDPATENCERGGNSALLQELGSGWTVWPRCAMSLNANDEIRHVNVLLRNDREPGRPPEMDMTQVELVAFVLGQMKIAIGTDDDNRAVELAAALYRATSPGTPPRDSDGHAAIVEEKRREVLPLLEHALGLTLIAGDPRARMVVYAGKDSGLLPARSRAA